MKKERIDTNHKVLIEAVIKESPKFRGNEELLDIFVEAIYKKSYLLIGAIKDMSRLKRHLEMICDGAMDVVIKEKQRFEDRKIYKQIVQSQENKENVVSIKKQNKLENPKDFSVELEMDRARRSVVNLKEEIQRSEKYNATNSLIDPLEFYTQKRISRNTLEKLIEIIKILDKKYPHKKYYDIFVYRYIKRFKQVAIAKELNLSQIELSKRFVEMIKLTREAV